MNSTRFTDTELINLKTKKPKSKKGSKHTDSAKINIDFASMTDRQLMENMYLLIAKSAIPGASLTQRRNKKDVSKTKAKVPRNNSYMLFAKQKRPGIRDEFKVTYKQFMKTGGNGKVQFSIPVIENGVEIAKWNVTKEIGKRWKTLSKDEQKRYKELAEKDYQERKAKWELEMRSELPVQNNLQLHGDANLGINLKTQDYKSNVRGSILEDKFDDNIPMRNI